MSKFKTAYSTLTSRTTIALGTKRAEQLCAEAEDGLFEKGTDQLINRVLKAVLVDTKTQVAKDLKAALKGAPILVLEALAETWRPRIAPTRCDVFYQIKDVQHQITKTIERIRSEIRTRKSTTTTKV